jgi:glycosyltransferase involved in cell wall biosynthesis
MSLAEFMRHVPLLSRLQRLIDQLETTTRELNALKNARVAQTGIAYGQLVRGDQWSADYEPWRHPYLAADNCRRFRDYSNAVWAFALEHAASKPASFTCAFTPNLVQNMYKWACLAQARGVDATLFLNDMDPMASNRPEWEEFDGEHPDVFDGAGFLARHPGLPVRVPMRRIPNRPEDNQLLSAYQEFCEGKREPLLQLLATSPDVRYETLLSYAGFYTYWELTRALSEYDVVFTANVPFAAYFSGRPYCAYSVGGDLSWDAGRADDWGRALTLTFNAARFLFISNPHTLGYCRRLGLSNGLFLPYPMDDRKYTPGEGQARREWEATYGPGTYVLTTARLDAKDKGYDSNFLAMLASVVHERPDVRFVAVAWGTNADALQEQVAASDLSGHLIFVLPAGKLKLIDYYRSCDVVLDQLVFGYYGATALEAASIARPIIMKLRTDHYKTLYEGDVMPVRNVSNLNELKNALVDYVSHPDRRARDGAAMRQWVARTHGEDRTMPVLLALLRLAADRVPLPKDLQNPLLAPLSPEEVAYHAACLRKAPPTT